MQYVHFDPYSRAVLGWIDTDAFTYPALPAFTELSEVTAEQWTQYQEAWASTQSVWFTQAKKFVFAQPAIVESLPDALANKLCELSEACGSAIISGFVSSALGEKYTYPSATEDQLNLTGSIQLASFSSTESTWTADFKCADSSGSWAARPHTLKQLQQVGAEFAKMKVSYIAKKDRLQALASACKTVEEIAKISWDADNGSNS